MSLNKYNKDNKLLLKYYGPYNVCQNIGTMAYKLELCAYSRVHLDFHVSCLNKFIGEKIPIQQYCQKFMRKEKSYSNLN